MFSNIYSYFCALKTPYLAERLIGMIELNVVDPRIYKQQKKNTKLFLTFLYEHGRGKLVLMPAHELDGHGKCLPSFTKCCHSTKPFFLVVRDFTTHTTNSYKKNITRVSGKR
jgi:hypothetical protein